MVDDEGTRASANGEGWLSQSSSPRLWCLLQYAVGGTVAKRGLVTEHYRGQRRVLEIGCSAGNIAGAFRSNGELAYTGVDVDPVAIEYARRAFRRRPNFRFLCLDMTRDRLAEEFDLVLVPGVLHHLEDDQCRRLLTAAESLLAPGALMLVIDPIRPGAAEGWLPRVFARIDRGRLRTEAETRETIRSVPSLTLLEGRRRLVGATPWGWPIVATFVVYLLGRTGT